MGRRRARGRLHDRLRPWGQSLTAIIIALVGAGVYGAGDFLGGLASRRSSWLPVTIFAELIGLAPLLLAIVALGSPLPLPRDALIGGAAGIVGAAGIGLLYRGLGAGTMSIVAPITAVCATAIPVLAGLAFGERPGTLALAGIGVAIAAIVLISQPHASATGTGTASVRASVQTALGSGVCLAGFLILMSRAQSGGLWPLFVSRVVATTALAVLAIGSRRALLPPRPTWTIAGWCGFFDAMGTICYVLAVRQGSLGVVATLIALYPVSTLILARAVLGERLRRRQMVGLACAAAAVALITSAKP